MSLKPIKYFSNYIFIAIATMGSALMPLSTSYGATTVTSSFTVSANVTASCSILATALSFGTYTLDVKDSTSTITATCTNGTTYTVGLDAGSFAGATVTTRKMTGPSASGLSYGLFTDSARATNWGNTTGSWVSGTGNGTAQTLTVYGRIPANQTATLGNYTDTVTVTITF